jgi:hypothetical protein
MGTTEDARPHFLASNVEPLRLPSQKHGSISRRIGQWIFVLQSALCLVSRPAALGFAACGTCLSPAPALVCLALDLVVLVFFLFACGARTSSVQITLTHFTSFGTSSEANPKQHAAVYLISICCSAKGQRLQGSAAVVGK